MNSKKNLKRNLLICLLAGSAVMYTLPLHAATSVVANNALPQNGQFFNGNQFIQGTANEKGNGFDFAGIGSITKPNDLTMNVHQNEQNAVIKWDSFDVGGSATVNFTAADAFKNNFNTLNYVNSGSASQIYGTINGLGGNIYVVNTAGVQIGPSAQINVGSLYVSNNVLDDSVFNNFVANANNANFDLGGKPTTYTDAALMSLGNINANNVTFEGNGRIVIDSERLINGNNSMGAANINIETAANNTGNIVIGYDAYDETTDSYNTAGTTAIAKVNGQDFAQNKGYMWVEDVEQLQAIDTNLSGNYALRNSIDATATKNWNNNKGFSSIGVDATGKTNGTGFTGKFDGIDYNIFGLTIDRDDETNVGLFGAATDATINNVTLVGGSINGSSNVGAIVGAAERTTICNVTNSAKVEGNNNVGGIVGIADNTTVENAINTGIVDAAGYNIGGLIGYMYNSNLGGNSYNLGDVSSEWENVGGLVGHAVNSTIGDGTNLIYNRLDVEGAYNVGGIVGNMEGSTVQNAENSGNVLATGYKTEDYTYHTANTNFDNAYGENGDGIGGVKVNVANVGGIVGTSSASDGKASQIKNVTNTANVSSDTGTYNQYGTQNEYYTAGNVGGVVGRAEDTNITNTTNRENEVRGAHNVGGVAGYFGGEGTIDGGINDGGDIMATGARAAAGVIGNVVNGNGFAREHVRGSETGSETFIVGNMGGVVGYMEGNDVYVTGSANRGTVHSQDINNPNQVLDISQAANTGGVVGKIDRNKINDEDGNILTNEDILAGIKDGSIKAAVTDSYNTGDVRGYTGVGGVIGMMYNGEVADSYNLGNINTTRQPVNLSNRDSVNMGGVVGDTTEGSGASAVIYNVYNKGQIGDENYETYARHVGGIVGRLSGIVDKSYNTGAIYNGYSVVGGIAGWFYEGTISNSFNTGNITVYNKETYKSGSQVGGIAGGMSAYSNSGTNAIYNAYNLGTLRSFNTDNTGNLNSIGGIVGKIESGVSGANTDVEIKNVYTTSNIYSSSGSGAASIYADSTNVGIRLKVEGANYIDLENNSFTNLDDNGAHKVSYSDRYNSTAYKFVELSPNEKIWADVNGASVSDDGYWRIYNNGDGTGTTPILNAFLPDSEKYFSTNGLKDKNGNFDGSVQYGTAYDPLLTIVNTNKDLIFDFGTNNNQLSISNAAGIAVYGGGLTFENFNTSEGTGYFGGTIYADGSLKLDGGTNDIGIGSASQIYGSDVAINTDGKITIYGDVTATGNEKDNDTTGGIDINAGDVDVYGTLTSAKDEEPTKVSGVAQGAVANFDFGDITDKDKAVTDIGNRFAVDVNSSVTGDITINAGTKVVTGDDGKSETVSIGDGNVNLYYGNKQEGLITTGGDLTVTGTGDVYVDSDLDIGGDLTLTGNGANSEVVLDLTNIGQVQAKNGTVDDAVTGLHNFMHHFSDTAGGGAQAGNKNISLNSASGDSKITVDMWDYENDKFYLGKYDETTADGHTFRDELNNLNLKVDKTVVANDNVKDHIYVWVNNGEQLKNIQTAANSNNDILSYNFALKNDINASDVKDYVAIGTDNANGFTGTFDGRGNRIIGLNVDKVKVQNTANAGIFSTVGEGGVVKDVNIYSGTFTGTTTAGAVAGVNKGRIEGIVTFGNTVTSNGNAGGIVGVNNSGGTVDDVESTGSVIAGSSSAVAGGLVGTNNGGLSNSFSDSAVTVDTNVTSGTSAGLGGVVGINNGNVQYVDSLGVTNGGATGSSNIGGIIGTNKGNMYSGFNESIVSGKDKVGGIIGNNTGTVTNIVNASSVDGFDTENASGTMAESNYVGGLVGTNSGSVTNGRNNGTITGTNYVGGMVGNNADEHSILTNLVNDSSAAIEGERYVGGIAGSNSGTITADKKNDNLINRGSITGNKYVGGVAGENKDGGTIANTLNSVVLHAKGDNAQYFGGVVGQNSGLINGATNTSDIDITAVGGTYVGGIIGENTQTGTLQGEIRNKGSVAGKSQVGGIIGKNDNDKVLQGKEKNRLIVTNDGTVDAEDGGAAGIFYENHGEIKYADISNSGVVNGGDKEGGTGGLFGINTGNITESTLTNSGTVIGGGIVGGLIGNNSGSAANSTFTNSGTVSGNTNVGGLFGTNSGNFSTSSLINTVNGQVIGISNVGGLIGYNTGTIIGGRNEAQETDEDRNVTAEKDSYYKYQIYNNGVVNVGTWNDKNSNGKVDDGEITGLQQGETSQNIGGLIGNNADEIATGGKKGSLTAGYNTGVINAGSSTTVGGIAGSNSGTIDQVFNTVYNTDGTKGAITGGTNVGGLVGTNSGEISNAYNTTDVFGNTVFGNAVGNNAAKGTIENIYASNNSGKLIGENINKSAVAIQNAYSFVNGDTSATDVISGGGQKDSDSYADFDFTNGTWKNYDGSSNPLLKVFLTTLTVDSDKVDLVYNAGEQDLNIGQLVYDGIITAPIVTDNEGNEVYNGLDAYHNTVIKGNNLGESDLLQNTTGQKDAGTYDNWLYSGQIAGSTDGSFNPNNLGYDVVYTTKTGNTDDGIEIDKATINISLDDIYRTYGDIDNIYSDADRTTERTYGESYTIDTSNLNDVLQQYIKDNLQVVGLSSDGSLTGDGKTQNVGDYNWSLKFTLAGDDASNYQINDSGLVSGVVVTGKNKAHVEKADLTINIKDVFTDYGTAFDESKYGYDFDKLVNGDAGNEAIYNAIKDAIDKAAGGYDNSGAADGTNGRVTEDAGSDYTLTFDKDIVNNDILKNYNIIEVNEGKATVEKADLSINIKDAFTDYGTAFDESKYGYDFDKLVNGDAGNEAIYNAIKDAIDKAAGGYDNSGAADGTNGRVTEDAGSDYSIGFNNDITGNNILKNYNITAVNNGDSNVGKAQINIGANDETISVGQIPNYSGTDIDGVLVNGDSLNGNYHYGVEDSSIESVVGTHNGAIGVWIGGSFYDLSNPDWSNLPGMSFFANYNVTFEPGTLTVSAYDIPEDWPHNRWDYLFNDAPFDRNKDFRERKAEVNFVDGGMEI